MLTQFHRLDLNLLRVLVAIDRCRSVTEAGRRLALSQPATSNALARLREAFGDRLFVRAAGALMPTPLAERIVPIAAQHLESLEAALTEPQAFDPLRSGAEWRLSLSDLGEMVFLPPIADAVLREAPRTRLTNVAVPAERVAEALGRREIDLAIGIMDPKQRGIRSTLLFRERYVALSGRGVPAGWRARAGFVDAALVVAAPAATHHQGIAESLERQRLGHRIVVHVRHYAAIPDLVSGGQLVAVVPEMFAQIACARLKLAMWPVPLAMPLFEVGMVWHATTDVDAAQIWLRERVLRLFRRGSMAGPTAKRRAAATVAVDAASTRR